MSEEEKTEVAEQIVRFKQYGPLIHNGRYYRLSNPMKDKFGIWSFVSEDKKQVLVQGMIFRTEPNMLRYPVRLRGLDPAKKYQLKDTEDVYTGQALMSGGIFLPQAWGDYVPVELYLTEV